MFNRPRGPGRCTNRHRGISLVESIVFIVVVSIGVTGVVILFNQLTRSSVDPVVRKQALAIATSLLEEVQLRGYTWCDPDDTAVFSATSAAGCTVPEVIGPEGGETRYADPRFDNVSDYDGFSMAGANLRDVTGTVIAGLGSYSASVSVTQPAGASLLPSVPAADQRLIVVSVSGPAGVNVSLSGYRTQYAPNQP
jgi:MSHA pilin protein MshD